MLFQFLGNPLSTLFHVAMETYQSFKMAQDRSAKYLHLMHTVFLNNIICGSTET